MSRYYDENEMARRRKEERSDDTYKAIINISNTIDANYSYLKSIDSSLEDIKCITEIKSDIADTRDLLSSVLVELKRNNTLKQRELRDKTTTEIKDLAGYTNKHLLYEDFSFINAETFVKNIVKKAKKQSCIINKLINEREFVAVLTNLNDGDYLLVDYNALSEKTIQTLTTYFQKGGYSIKLEQKKKILETFVPLSKFNCIIFTECKETVDRSLLKCLEIVK